MGPEPSYPDHGVWELSARQSAVYSALSRLDSQLGSMFISVYYVLASGNPERVPLAAHSVRELMEKLPQRIDVPVENKTNLKEAVNNLKQHWKTVADNERNPAASNGHVRKFHRKAGEFFEWFTLNYPARRAERRAAIRCLDVSGRPMPEPIAKVREDLWGEYHGYFQGVAHHNSACSEDDFFAQLSVLEEFLMDLLCPHTFDDFTALDAIIEEGESHA